MPAASYKKDMVGRTRISDRLDIEYLPEIRFLGIVLRFSQKMCKAVRHHVSWPTFWAYFCWFFKCCFASLLHHFENTNLLLKTIQYFRNPRFRVLTYLPDPSLTTSMILKWGRRREVKWLIFIWPDDVCLCVHMIFYAFYASRPFQRTYELPIGQFKRDEWKWNCAFYDTP